MTTKSRSTKKKSGPKEVRTSRPVNTLQRRHGPRKPQTTLVIFETGRGGDRSEHIPESVKEARAGLIPSEETDALLPLPGPLEVLDGEGLENHCEMCGDSKLGACLEAAFNPSGQAKTLCYACRIGSAEVLSNLRKDMLAMAELVLAGNTEFDVLEKKAREILHKPEPTVEKLFDSRELATVLAALRYWQRAIGVDSLPVGPLEKNAYMGHFDFSGDVEDQCLPLSADDIDDLCERINR